MPKAVQASAVLIQARCRVDVVEMVSISLSSLLIGTSCIVGMGLIAP